MKVIAIVGIRQSGKTSIVEALTRSLTARGLKVGTVKSIFCPSFHMDKAGSNTDRHHQAGAVLTCARAKKETAFIAHQPLKASAVYRAFSACDVVLAEGDYALPVPRIVAAHSMADAAVRINGRTLALSGRIADAGFRHDTLPILHFERDIDALCRLVLAVPEVEDVTALDEDLHGPDIDDAKDYCRTACHGHHRRPAGVQLSIDGETVTLSEHRQALIRALIQS